MDLPLLVQARQLAVAINADDNWEDIDSDDDCTSTGSEDDVQECWSDCDSQSTVVDSVEPQYCRILAGIYLHPGYAASSHESACESIVVSDKEDAIDLPILVVSRRVTAVENWVRWIFISNDIFWLSLAMLLNTWLQWRAQDMRLKMLHLFLPVFLYAITDPRCRRLITGKRHT